jgi:hypothetical protein
LDATARTAGVNTRDESTEEGGVMAKHAPGPWHLDVPYIEDSTNARIASLASRFEAEANGHLLAAAPDLFAALKAIIDSVASCTDDYGKPTTEICQVSDFSEARAAIAKAEGTP